MSQQDAIGYKESNNGQSCDGCCWGQFDSVCLRHNFKCAPTHTCDTHEPAHPLPLSSFKVVNLEPPHGFLVWRGKQTAIASPDALPIGQVMITSGEEAFGSATLSQPAQMTLAEFEREEQSDRHRIRPEERKMLWPKAQALYVYGIKEWNGFSEPQPVIDGHITLYEPTPEEAALIEKSKRLPKVITLESEAVTLTDGGFTALDGVRGRELSEALKATFGRFRFLDSQGDKALPLYDLALIRQPALRFEKVLSRVLSAEKAHNGVMVAFILPAVAAAKLALSQDTLPEGATVLPPEELHLTLSYLGKKDELEGRETIERVLSALTQEWGPLVGKVGGIGRFSNIESDGTQAFYASFDSAALPEFRQELISRLKGAGVQSPSTHGFTPHITLAYLPREAEMPNIILPDIELSFNELTLAWGDDHKVFPLTGEVKKKSTEAENMPIETDAAKAEAAQVETGEKRSLQELELIRARFEAKFCGHYGDWRSDPHPINVTDDSEVIVIWQGTLYAVPFTQTEGGEITFSPQLGWVPVKTTYTPVESTAMKTTAETGAADTKPTDTQVPTDQAEAATPGPQVTQVKAGRRLASGWMDRLRAAKDALQELFTWAEYGDREEEPEEGAMMLDMLKGSSGVAVKMVNGEPWHCSWSSNAFEDRDEEIFSLKALEDYVKANEENEIKGWFNLWHIKGTDFAEKRYQAIIGKFLFEAGPYLKDEKGQKALAFFKAHPGSHPELAPEGWGASVEYRYLPEERKNKVYEWTWITRTSTLARGAAANIWTKSSQEIFTMTEEQKKAAVAMFGEEFTKQLIAQGEQKTKELEEAGVASKQAQGTAPEEKPTPEKTEGEKQATEVPAALPPADSQPATPPATPAGESAQAPDPNQFLAALAAEMMKGLNETLTPILTGIKQDIQALGDRVGTLETEQATKQKVEMPRFVFSQLMASQSPQTAVTEGDALKNQKPAEAAANTDGSMAGHYFPTRK